MLLSHCPDGRGGRFILLMAGLIALSLGSSSSLHAQTLDLDELISRAEASNPSLHISKRMADVAESDLPLATSLPSPRINLSFFPYPIFTARGSQRSRLLLEQSIPLPGTRRIRGRIVETEVRSAELLTEALRADLKLSVTEAYDELYQAQEMLLLIGAFSKELARFENAALVQYEVGRESISPVLNIQNELRSLLLHEKQVEERRITAIRKLAVLVDGSVEISSDSYVAERHLTPIGRESLAELKAEALGARPLMAALDQSLQKSELAVMLAKRETFPELNLGLEYADIAREGFLDRGDGTDALGLKVGIRIPIWSGARKAPVERARLEAKQIDDQSRALITDISTTVDELASLFTSQTEQLTLIAEDLIPRAEFAHETALSSYTTGNTPYIDVLDTARTLYSLRTQELTTRIRMMLTHAQLERELFR